jgi:sugar phosphate isomerase/epimerase
VLEPAVPISVFNLQPRQGLAVASRLGFRSVCLSAAQPGLRPRELDRSARRGLLGELRRLELDCSCIDLLLPREHYQQPQHVDRALSATVQAIELAADLGARSIFLRLPPVTDAEEPDELTRELAAVASASPVRVCDTTLDGPGMTAHRSGWELPVDVGMDTAAWLSEGRDPLAGIVELGPRLAGVRLVDLDGNGSRVPLVLGRRLDLDSIRTGLETGGFEGAVVLDASGWQDPVNGLLQDLQAWRALRPASG